MIHLTVGSLICLVLAIFCIAAAFIIAILGRIAASQKGAIGCFVLAIVLFCMIAGLWLWVGFA